MRFNPFTEIRTALRDLGLRETLRLAPRWLFDVAERYKRNREQRAYLASEGFDQRHGTDTAEMMLPSELGHIASSSGGSVHDYQTLSESELRMPLASLEHCGFQDFTFIDIGCGKGKPLLIASEFAFRRVIGVDISKSCIAIAKHNIELFTRGNQKQIDRFQLVVSDAEFFTFPCGPLFLFLFNPFGLSTLEKMLDALKEALNDEQRKVLIAYRNLDILQGGREAILATGLFDTLPDLGRYSLFATKPSDWALKPSQG